jgi:hypothetical protein
VTWLVTIAPLAALMFVYVANVGQVVHGTPNPTWWERLGR